MKTTSLYGLLATFFSIIFLFACSKEDEKVSDDNGTNVETSHLIDVVARVVRESGLDFPQGSPSGDREGQRPSDFEWPPEEYVSVDNSDREEIVIKLWLGPDNHIIPTPDWQAANPGYCQDQGKYMRPAVKLLQFKVFNAPRDGIRAVQLNYIDIPSGGRIEHSVMTDWYEADPDWIYQAMSEVWDEMRTRATIEGAVEPCEERFSLTLHFNSTVKFDYPDALFFEEFEFAISLNFDETKGGFTGIGDIVWLEGYLYDKDEDVYIPYPPQRGQMEIVKLITPELAGNSIENATMNFRVPIISAEYPSILLLSFAEFYDWVGNQDETMEFEINNWQLLNDPDVIMGAYMNNEKIYVDEYGEISVLTENTSIEISR